MKILIESLRSYLYKNVVFFSAAIQKNEKIYNVLRRLLF